MITHAQLYLLRMSCYSDWYWLQRIGCPTLLRHQPPRSDLRDIGRLRFSHARRRNSGAGHVVSSVLLQRGAESKPNRAADFPRSLPGGLQAPAQNLARQVQDMGERRDHMSARLLILVGQGH